MSGRKQDNVRKKTGQCQEENMTKKLEFRVPKDLLERFETVLEARNMNRSYVLRAMVAGFATYQLSIVDGRAVPTPNPVQGAGSFTPSDTPKRGRPPKEDESWRRIPGCTDSKMLGIIQTFDRLDHELQDLIIKDNDVGWYEQCFNKTGSVKLTLDNYIRKGGGAVKEQSFLERAGLPPDHKFLGDVR